MTSCRNFADLVLNAVKGEDYGVTVVNRDASTTVAAIHGGCIAPPTGELARAIAGEDCNLYELRGLRADKAALLRIPASRYDEMRLRALMERSEDALAIVGVEGAAQVVHLGGRNQALRQALADELVAAGFVVGVPATPGAAHDPTRFYNLPANGGVQVELTRALLCELLAGPHTPRFDALVTAVRAGLAQYRATLRDDVGHALQRFERATEALPASLRKPHCCD
jgi:phage replication-related protein YjqB (UPF0714/DUF867 family)